MESLGPFLAAFIVVVALPVVGVVPLALVAWRWRKGVEDRHSPLNRDLRRPPGYSLSKRLEEVNSEHTDLFGLLSALPGALAAAFLIAWHRGASEWSWVSWAPSGVLLFVGLVCACRKFWRLLSERGRLIIGLEGEQFVGEELSVLMRDGCYVYHDVPIPDGGNIDHVVVSPSGVFSINTKTYRKSEAGPENARVTIDYGTNRMLFPDWTQAIPTERLKYETDWLGRELSSAAGFAVSVKPMLALPGWYVERKGAVTGVCVFNPKSPQALFINGRTILDAERMERLAHQLDRMTRDVPRSFKRKGKWEQ